MRAPANPPASWLGRLALSFVAFIMATTFTSTSAMADVPANRAADEVVANEPHANGAAGATADEANAGDAGGVRVDAAIAEQLSVDLPLASILDANGLGGQVAIEEAETLAGYLASGRLRVNVDMVLASDDELEPVVGSFTVDGLTYAVTGEDEAAFVAVAPATLAGSLVGGSADGSPTASEGGAPSFSEGDGSNVAGSSDEPAVLVIPASVEHGGVAYAVTSVGPRALAGCDADVVIIPATVELVDESAFQGSAVAAVEVAEGNPHYSSYDGMLFDAEQIRLLLIPEGKQGAAHLPSTAEVVDPSSFSHSAGVDAIDVEADSAAFSSRNGCLYDASGETLLWGPASAPVAASIDRASTMAWSSSGRSGIEERSASRAAGDTTVDVDLDGGWAGLTSSLIKVGADGKEVETPVPTNQIHEENFSLGFSSYTCRNVRIACVWDDYPHYTIEWEYSAKGFNGVDAWNRFRWSFWKNGCDLAAYTLNETRYGADIQDGQSSIVTNLRTGTAYTLKLNWDKIPCEITYLDDDGKTELTTLSPTSYKIQTYKQDLPIPTKLGYTFKGWTVKADYSYNTTNRQWKEQPTDKPVVQQTQVEGGPIKAYIEADRWANLRLTANWDENVISFTPENCSLGMYRHWITHPGATNTEGRRSEWYDIQAGVWMLTEPTANQRTWSTVPARRIMYPKVYELGNSQGIGELTNAEYTIYEKNGRYIYRLFVYPDDGYEFSHWVEEESEIKSFPGTYGSYNCTPGKKYKAVCEAIENSISYDLVSGSYSDSVKVPKTYKVTDEDVVLPNPVRTGYAFVGWEVEGARGKGLKQEKVTGGTWKVTLLKGTFGDLTLKAKWTERAAVIDATPGSIWVERYRTDAASGELSFEKFSVDNGRLEIRAYEALVLYLGPTRREASVRAYDGATGDMLLDYVAGSRAGYKAVGWTKDGADVKPTYVLTDSNWAAGEQTGTYKVKWEPISYTVRYKPSGGGGGDYARWTHKYRDQSDADYGKNDKTLFLNDYMAGIEGGAWYTFLGWSKDTNDDEAEYGFEQEQPNVTAVDGEEVTLYLAKQKNAATFDPNGGTLYQHGGDLHGEGSLSTASSHEVTWTQPWNMEGKELTTNVSSSEPRATFRQNDLELCLDVVRPGYIFQGWKVEDRKGELVSMTDWMDKPIVRGATYVAQWVPALRVDVPIEVNFDLTVDWESAAIEVMASGSDGEERAIGVFSSQSAEDVRVISMGQEAWTAEENRIAALKALAQGEEGKAGNLDQVRLTLRADVEDAREGAFPLSALYELHAGAHPGSMASPQDLSSLGLVVPAAASADAPGTLRVRYGMDCAGLPLEDVAIGERARPILKLVYLVELASS